MLETVILARHGESEYSAKGLVNGDPTVRVPLTQRGREEARLLGERLGDRELDLCVTSDFLRAEETADGALAGREVPRLVVPELGDIHMGGFEGATLEEYRAWAHNCPPTEEGPGGGESRVEAVERYVKGFSIVAARPERTILVVSHSLPIRYVLEAADGIDPQPAMGQADYATPYALAAAQLQAAIDRLARWAASPHW
jgi:broad specificity phosphatase PhoE